MSSGFDEVAKAIATNMPRRKVLKLIAGTVVASVSSGLLGSAASANSTPSTSDVPLPPGTDYCDSNYCYSNGTPTYWVNGTPINYDVNGVTYPVPCLNGGDPCVNVNSPCFNYNSICVNNVQPPNPCVNVVNPCVNADDPCFNYNGICVNKTPPPNPCVNAVTPCVNVSDPCFNYNGVCVNNTPPNPCVNAVNPCVNVSDPCFNYNGLCVNNTPPAVNNPFPVFNGTVPDLPPNSPWSIFTRPGVGINSDIFDIFDLFPSWLRPGGNNHSFPFESNSSTNNSKTKGRKF